jgi:hypothetical protein
MQNDEKTPGLQQESSSKEEAFLTKPISDNDAMALPPHGTEVRTSLRCMIKCMLCIPCGGFQADNAALEHKSC